MIKPNFMARASLSQLIIIDIQLRLMPVMPADKMQELVKNCGILIQSAAWLEVPVIVSEQYPRGLGHTVPEILTLLPDVKPVAKTAFSCVAEPKFKQLLTGDHSQIIIAGMETHICVLQTALDLLTLGKQVFIVEDAVISRNPANKANALARLRDAGCMISNSESIVFEWLGRAEGEVFKKINQLVR